MRRGIAAIHVEWKSAKRRKPPILETPLEEINGIPSKAFPDYGYRIAKGHPEF